MDDSRRSCRNMKRSIGFAALASGRMAAREGKSGGEAEEIVMGVSGNEEDIAGTKVRESGLGRREYGQKGWCNFLADEASSMRLIRTIDVRRIVV